MAVLSGSEDTAAATVLGSAAVDLVTRLYVLAHVEQGDFEQLPKPGDTAVSMGSRELLLRYFGADFSLGMSLIITCVVRGWKSVEELTAGVAGLDGDELVAEMLASTTLEPKDQNAARELVAAALADVGQRQPTARKIARRLAYRRRDVEYILEDPARAHLEFGGLLHEGASAFPTGPGAQRALQGRVDEVRSHIVEQGREQALLELTGGWTLRSEVQPIVLVPTEALGPLVITRLLPDQRILVAFGPTRARELELSVPELAAVARALSSEQRIAILRHVAQEPANGQTLAKALRLTQATVHYHTALLRSCGLITSTRDSHSVLHAVDGDHLRRALGLLGDAVLADGDPMPEPTTGY